MRLSASVALLALACAAQAQPWPSKPVRVVIPWPPGQATDIATRLVGQRLQDVVGHPFVMDNKPGAGGAIGTAAVAKAPPDGYTLLGCSSGPMAVLPNVQKAPYDPLRDLTPLAITSSAAYVLVTSSSFPAANAKDLVTLLRLPIRGSTASRPPALARRLTSSSWRSTPQPASRRRTSPTRAASPR